MTQRNQDLAYVSFRIFHIRCNRRGTISEEDRNYIASGFEKVVGSLMSSWDNTRVKYCGVNTLGTSGQKPKLAKKYMDYISSRVQRVCFELLYLIKQILHLGLATSIENMFFCFHVRAECNHCLFHLLSEEVYRERWEQSRFQARIVLKKLSQSHPMRLSLCQNQAVLFRSDGDMLYSEIPRCKRYLDSSDWNLKIENAFDTALSLIADSDCVETARTPNLNENTLKLSDLLSVVNGIEI